MTKRGRIILKETNLRRFKERADDIRRFANVISKAFLGTMGIVHIMYSQNAHELLKQTFGSGFVE